MKQLLLLILVFNPILGYGQDRISNPQVSNVPARATIPFSGLVSATDPTGNASSAMQSIESSLYYRLLLENFTERKMVSDGNELQAAILAQETHIQWVGRGGLGGLSSYYIPPNVTFYIGNDHYIDFADGSLLHIAGPIIAPPHAHIFRNTEPTPGSFPSVFGHFGGVDRYMGWWLEAKVPPAPSEAPIYDTGDIQTTKEVQACIDSVLYDTSDFDIPDDWRNNNSSFTTWHTSGTVHVPYGGIVLRDTIDMTAFSAELKGPGGNGAYFSFQAVNKDELFHFTSNTPNCVFRNIYIHVNEDCKEGLGVFTFDDPAVLGTVNFFEGCRFIAVNMIIEVPCDAFRAFGISWNHVAFDGCNWLFQQDEFPDPPQDPPTVPRMFNLATGAKNVKLSVRNCTFVGTESHDTPCLVYDLKGQADSLFVENCHHETWGNIFRLEGHQVNPTFYQIGEIRGIGISAFNSSPSNPLKIVDLVHEDWRGIVDITFETSHDGLGATLSTSVDDARHNGVFRSGGNLNLPANTAQVETFNARADIGGDLDGKYFVLYDENGSVGVWFDIDNSGTPPPAGVLTLDRDIEVIGAVTGDSDTNVAAATVAALTADSQYSASNVGNFITLTHVVAGEREDGFDFDANFTLFLVSVDGSSGYKFSGLGNNPKWWRYKAHATGAKATGNSAYEFILAQ